MTPARSVRPDFERKKNLSPQMRDEIADTAGRWRARRRIRAPGPNPRRLAAAAHRGRAAPPDGVRGHAGDVRAQASRGVRRRRRRGCARLRDPRHHWTADRDVDRPVRGLRALRRAAAARGKTEAAGRPQRSLPLRQRQEVQALPPGGVRERRRERSLPAQITLRGTQPPIWRLVEVVGDQTLGELHQVIQTSMGWFEEHLHGFEVAGRKYGPASDEGFGPPELDEDRARLGDLLQEGDRFFYEYDFGDSWEHQIEVEKVAPRAAKGQYPRSSTARAPARRKTAAACPATPICRNARQEEGQEARGAARVAPRGLRPRGLRPRRLRCYSGRSPPAVIR